MEIDPYVVAMPKSEWREFTKRAESLSRVFDSAWDWDRTAEICRVEVFETSECLICSVAFRFAGHDVAITITGQDPEGLVQTVEQFLVGLGWHMSDLTATAKELGLDKRKIMQ